MQFSYCINFNWPVLFKYKYGCKLLDMKTIKSYFTHFIFYPAENSSFSIINLLLNFPHTSRTEVWPGTVHQLCQHSLLLSVRGVALFSVIRPTGTCLPRWMTNISQIRCPQFGILRCLPGRWNCYWKWLGKIQDWAELSVMSRCPLGRGVRKGRFYCIFSFHTLGDVVPSMSLAIPDFDVYSFVFQKISQMLTPVYCHQPVILWLKIYSGISYLIAV
jgi:hypothetical protein